MSNQLLDTKYYCGRCDNVSKPTKDRKCNKCKSRVVKWSSKLSSRDYALDLWIDENENQKFRLFKSEKGAFAIIGIGIFILTSILIMFLSSYPSFKLTGIDSTLFSQFGDVSGGLVGAIWSLAGVILFYLALQSQIKNNTINRDLLLTQISLLNNQLEEYQESLEQTKIIAQTNIETNESICKQLDIMSQNLEIDKYAILANVNIQLSRNELTEAKKNQFLLTAKDYLKRLNEIIDKKP